VVVQVVKLGFKRANMNHFRHNCPVSVTLELFFLHIMDWFQRDTHSGLDLALIQI